MNYRNRLKRINWFFIILLTIILNLLTIIDKSFFDWKMNSGILFFAIVIILLDDKILNRHR